VRRDFNAKSWLPSCDLIPAFQRPWLGGRVCKINSAKSKSIRFCEQSCAVDLVNGGKSAAATAFANKQTAAGPAASAHTRLKFSSYAFHACLKTQPNQSVRTLLLNFNRIFRHVGADHFRVANSIGSRIPDRLYLWLF
jgi:hypothetical protein